MQVALIVSGFGFVLLIALAIASLWRGRAIQEDVPDLGDEPVSEASIAELPEGHRPPPGLSPLSPSERFLSAEVERGLRDLQAYLLDAA